MYFFNRFWEWYNKHLALNTAVAAGLFLLQLVHLYWLSADVVATRLTGRSFFELTGIWHWFILVVDYTEIPAILGTSLVYLNEVRQGKKLHGLLYLFFINSQWLHIFWITDEFVIEAFTQRNGTVLPFWLTWVALAIDYLELPVIFDTAKKTFNLTKQGKFQKALEILKEG